MTSRVVSGAKQKAKADLTQQQRNVTGSGGENIKKMRQLKKDIKVIDGVIENDNEANDRVANFGKKNEKFDIDQIDILPDLDPTEHEDLESHRCMWPHGEKH